jgi:hypothetical protein
VFEERPSFLRKRSKKLLSPAVAAASVHPEASGRCKCGKQKFFGSFLQKRTAYFLIDGHRQC